MCKAPTSETVQDSYNSGSFKNRMSYSSGGHFHQSCQVTKSCVILNWHQRRQTCRVLRREGWRSVCCRRRRRMFVTKVCSSATSVKFPLRKCGKWWRVRLSIATLDPLPTFTQRELVDVTPNGPWHIKFKIVLMEFDCIVDSEWMYAHQWRPLGTYHSRQATIHWLSGPDRPVY